MKKKKANSARNKKIIIAVAVVVVLIAILVLLSLRPVKNYSEKYAGTNLDVEVKGMERTGTYKQYVLKHADAAKPNSTIDINHDHRQDQVRHSRQPIRSRCAHHYPADTLCWCYRSGTTEAHG